MAAGAATYLRSLPCRYLYRSSPWHFPLPAVPSPAFALAAAFVRSGYRRPSSSFRSLSFFISSAICTFYRLFRGAAKTTCRHQRRLRACRSGRKRSVGSLPPLPRLPAIYRSRTTIPRLQRQFYHHFVRITHCLPVPVRLRRALRFVGCLPRYGTVASTYVLRSVVALLPTIALPAFADFCSITHHLPSGYVAAAGGGEKMPPVMPGGATTYRSTVCCYHRYYTTDREEHLPAFVVDSFSFAVTTSPHLPLIYYHTTTRHHR